MLNELAARYSDTLRVYAIGYEEPDPRKLRAVAEEFGFKVPVLVDARDTLSKGYAVTGLPRGFLIDSYGYLSEIHKGMSDKIADELRSSIAAKSAAILERRKKGLKVFVKDFANLDERGRKNGTGSAAAAALRKTLAGAGIEAAKSSDASTLIVSGTVSDLGAVVGVEFVLAEPEKGRELERDRASVVGGNYGALTEALLETLEPYRAK